MALARYFDKAAMSAASMLKGVEYSRLREILNAHRIAVRYDAVAATSREGRWTLELLTGLLARLYPTLSIAPLPGAGPELARQLEESAQAINRLIDFASPEEATVSVVVGESVLQDGGDTLYAGSDGWIARVASAQPCGSGDGPGPFGAGAAACLAAAWVFRTVFYEYLPPRPRSSAADPESLSLSLVDLGPSAHPDPLPLQLDLGDVHLVGLGAIGNGAVWALARTPGLSGRVHLVDGERLELSNVQRYVLACEDDEDAEKVSLAAREWERPGGDEGILCNEIQVEVHGSHWAEYVSTRRDYYLERVLLALDSAEDRVAVQASLPRWIANAWTQPENLGVSRHEFLGPGPCVACLYLPKGESRNFDELVAEAIGAPPEELMQVRRLLHSGEPIGMDLLQRIAERLGVPAGPLLPFAGASLESFYSRAVCGGILLSLGMEAGRGRPAEVPMAFQSAMAGLLLAAEVVVDVAGLRSDRLPARSELDLLRQAGGLGLRPHTPTQKDASGRCLCADDVFRRAYVQKYGDA